MGEREMNGQMRDRQMYGHIQGKRDELTDKGHTNGWTHRGKRDIETGVWTHGEKRDGQIRDRQTYGYIRERQMNGQMDGQIRDG